MTTQISQLRPVFYSYDIPERAKIKNPSRFLRRRAIRINLSVWCMPEAMIPYALTEKLEAAGATVYCVAFDAREAENMLAILTDALVKDAKRAVARAEAAIGKAERKLAESKDSIETTQASFDYAAEKAVKRAEALLGDFREAAKVFGIDENTLPIAASYKAVSALQAAASNRAKHYVEMARAAAQISPAIGEAAQRDQMAPGALVDLLEENGVDVTDAREAFVS